MKALHEMWNVSEDKVDQIAKYPFEINGYAENLMDIESFKSICQKTGADPRNGEIYPQWNGSRFVPTLTTDGWLRLANDHPEYKGYQITYSDEETSFLVGDTTIVGTKYIEVAIYRGDREHPAVAREYLVECFNVNNQSHYTHPNRNLRHKCMAQAIKIAFGISGAAYPDEIDASSISSSAAASSQAHNPLKSDEKCNEKSASRSVREKIQTQPPAVKPSVKVVIPTGEVAAEPLPSMESMPVQEALSPQTSDGMASPACESVMTESAVTDEGKEDSKSDADAPEFEPDDNDIVKLNRFISFAMASGKLKDAQLFIDTQIIDPLEQAWYQRHFDTSCAQQD